MLKNLVTVALLEGLKAELGNSIRSYLGERALAVFDTL